MSHLLPTLLYLFVFSQFLLVNCAKKPSAKVAEGSLDSVYKKSEFTSQPHEIGSASPTVSKFIRAAMAKENPNDFQLLSNPKFKLMSSGDRVVFKDHDDALRMYFEGSDNPVAEWSITHCNVEVMKTNNGEDTRYLTSECDDGKSHDKYTHFRGEFETPQVRTLPQSLHDIMAKETINEVASNGLKLKTGKFTHEGEETSRVFDEKTGKYIVNGSSLSLARQLVVDKNVAGFNILGPVEFELKGFPILNLDSSTLPDVEVLGENDREYPVQLRLTENDLVVEKIVSLDEIASVEKTYAIDLGNGSYAVPLVGYSISKFRIEHKLQNGIKTASLEAVSVNTLEEATHVKVHQDAVKEFKRQKKLDVFEKDFLAEESEWYFVKTIVDAPLDSSDNSFGALLGVQEVSGRVRIHRTKGSIQLVDVNIPLEAIDATGDDMQVLLEIPAKWIDYNLVTSGPEAYLAEEVLEDGSAGARQWYERDWVSFEFNRADHLSDARSDNYKLERLEISDGYIGFDVYVSENQKPKQPTDEEEEEEENQEIPENQLTFKYSLVKAPKKIDAGKVYYVADRDKFGFFATQQSYYDGVITEHEEDKENKILVQRMYPSVDESNEGLPTIWYYLTDNSPEYPFLQEAAQEAVEAWDKAFMQAAVGTGQTPISVKLGKERVSIGDVRYNKITFFDYDRYTDGLLGRGPSVVDSRNGTIHSATNNIYLRQYREGIWDAISDYVRYKVGQLDQARLNNLSHVLPESELMLGNGGLNSVAPVSVAVSSASHIGLNRAFEEDPFRISIDSLLKIDPSYKSSLGGFPQKLFHSKAHNIVYDYKNNGIVDVERLANNTVLSAFDIEKHVKKINSDYVITDNNRQTCNAIGALRNRISDIEKLCFNKDGSTSGLMFHQYMEELLALNAGSEEFVTHIADIKEQAFSSCSDILLKKKLIATLVHEFGHNFGLRHNFKGSTDKANFPKDDNGEIVSETSTVMEYTHDDVDRAFNPGPYDIAAIRYGYYDTIEVQESLNQTGGTVDLVSLSGKSIAEALQAKRKETGKSLVTKPYRYCTDFEFAEPEGYGLQRPLDDPNCRRWDVGTTPSERAEAFIRDFNTFIITESHRFDKARAFSVSAMGNISMSRFFIPLKIIYDHYRYLLVTEIPEIHSDPYLVNISPDELKQLVAESGKKEIIEYQEAVENVIYPFLRELVFSPARYCVLESADGQRDFIEFEEGRQNIYNDSKDRTGIGLVANSCGDVSEYLSSIGEFDGTNMLAVGNLFGELPWSPDKREQFDRFHVQAGLEFVRFTAMIAMVNREALSGITQEERFTPSMLDEKDKMAELSNLVTERLVEGERMSKLLSNTELEGYLPTYKREEQLLQNYTNLVKGFARAPDNTVDPVRDMKALVRAQFDLRSMFNIPQEVSVDAFLAQNGFRWRQDTRNTYYVTHPQINPKAYALLEQADWIQDVRQFSLTKEVVPITLNNYLLVVKRVDSDRREMIANGEENIPSPRSMLNSLTNFLVNQNIIGRLDAQMIMEMADTKLAIGSDNPVYFLGEGNAEDLDGIVKDKVSEFLNEKAERYESYEKHKSEYDTQLRLLEQIILSDS